MPFLVPALVLLVTPPFLTPVLPFAVAFAVFADAVFVALAAVAFDAVLLLLVLLPGADLFAVSLPMYAVLPDPALPAEGLAEADFLAAAAALPPLPSDLASLAGMSFDLVLLAAFAFLVCAAFCPAALHADCGREAAAIAVGDANRTFYTHRQEQQAASL